MTSHLEVRFCNYVSKGQEVSISFLQAQDRPGPSEYQRILSWVLVMRQKWAHNTTRPQRPDEGNLIWV